MRIKTFIILLSCTLFLLGCSTESPEPEVFTSIQLKNTTSDQKVAVFLTKLASSSNDTLITLNENPLLHIEANNMEIRAGETRVIDRFVMERRESELTQGAGMVYFVIDTETLRTKSWEEIKNSNVGVTSYFIDNASLKNFANEIKIINYPKR